MIEGLKYDVSSNELSNHLAERIAHHEERLGFYTKQVDTLRSGRAEHMEYTNGDPIRNLEGKADEHGRRVQALRFLRDHLIPNETYRLEEGDLENLEIVRARRPW